MESSKVYNERFLILFSVVVFVVVFALQLIVPERWAGKLQVWFRNHIMFSARSCGSYFSFFFFTNFGNVTPRAYVVLGRALMKQTF